jgi:hypothetical protein
MYESFLPRENVLKVWSLELDRVAWPSHVLVRSTVISTGTSNEPNRIEEVGLHPRACGWLGPQAHKQPCSSPDLLIFSI